MIALLHGYLLDGSGSNLWTQAMVRSLCRIGEDVQLVCQERHPEEYDFVAEARVHPAAGECEVLFRRDTGYPGRCVLHRPELGDTLPVYVPDRYEGFRRVVPMTRLSDEALADYLDRNRAVVERVVAEEGVTALHANHAVLMSVVARRVAAGHGLPYAVMPHGSALEYAVKQDARLREMARSALLDADVIFVIGAEMTRRLTDVFPDLPALGARMTELPLGVDVELFRPVARGRRGEAVAALRESLDGVPRGRRPEQVRALREAVEASRTAGSGGDGAAGGSAGDSGAPDLERLWASSSDYPLKEPDAGLEAALARVDWDRADVVLFVGRLIAAKGVQYVVAALPSMLERRPAARLVVVGHGPLREPLETLVHALGSGDEALLRRVVEVAGRVEGGRVEGGRMEGGRMEGGRMEGGKARGGFAAIGDWLDALERRGQLGPWLARAAEADLEERLVFTGYLTHARLRHLFAVADVAVFPSRVREAGPLVFLEAMAAGAFPLGTYFGGMAASIDAAAASVPPEAVERMKLRTPDAREGGIIADIADGATAALRSDARLGPRLRRHVRERHDWRAVARRLRDRLVR